MRHAQTWSTIALSIALLGACGDDEDTTTTDTVAAETATAAETTVAETATAAETTVAETTVAETTVAETTVAETTVAETTTTETTETDTATAQDTAPDETAAGVTFDDPHAIFAVKCTPCHAGGSSGGHNMAATDVAAAFTDSQKAAVKAACAGKTKGACTLIRIQAGQMPAGRGCSGNPETDAANSACLTAAQQATLKAWIDGGQLAPL